MTTIDLYCNDGSPLGVTPPDIYGRGVGGAELAMMTWAEVMASRGHTIRVYNNPKSPGVYDGVEYLNQGQFEPTAGRDAFIIYRSPNKFVQSARALRKIHWSTDQQTVGNFGRDIFPFVDKVVCISPYHVDYHKRTYGVAAEKIGYIDLGVRLADYDQEISKIPGRCIFCSVPDRGLDVLRACWPEIKKQVPAASLVITSDYRLWGSPNPNNHQHRLEWLGEQDVAFLGKVERHHLIKEQLAAEVQAFPCTYEELFCISAAECQVAGAVPVTSGFGALPTTNKWGVVIHGNPMEHKWRGQFVEAVVAALKDGSGRKRGQAAARKRFDWAKICAQWEYLFETGEIK